MIRGRVVFGYVGSTGCNPLWQAGPNWVQVTIGKVALIIWNGK